MISLFIYQKEGSGYFQKVEDYLLRWTKQKHVYLKFSIFYVFIAFIIFVFNYKNEGFGYLQKVFQEKQYEAGLGST